MLPWKNPWFQIAVFAVAFSAIILFRDIFFGGFSSSKSKSHAADNTSYSNPAPAPYTPPPAPANNTPYYPPSAPANQTQQQQVNAWTNSLGMKFVPAGTNGVLFSVWLTRVRDFQIFANETNFRPDGGIFGFTNSPKMQMEANLGWNNPGFPQVPDDPVCGVSWNDATAFCAWLTNKERQSRVISSDQTYRLPTDAEWSTAAGNTTYPWGDEWPPPPNVANLGRYGDGYRQSPLFAEDGYRFTSPVGTFQPNAYGLYDMSGNLSEWCEDFYNKGMNTPDLEQALPAAANDGGGQEFRVLRGASWNVWTALILRTACHEFKLPTTRSQIIGFRCVLAKPD